MSKAILVLDMPKSCFYCEFCHTTDYDPRKQLDGDKYCCLFDCDYNVEKYYYAAMQENYIKPDWCPLLELPEKHDLAVRYDRDYDCEFEYGWNCCLDEILGGEYE